MQKKTFIKFVSIVVFVIFMATLSNAQDKFIGEKYVYDKSHSREGLKGGKIGKEEWFLELKTDNTVVLNSEIAGKNNGLLKGSWIWDEKNPYLLVIKFRKYSYRFEIADNAFYLVLEEILTKNNKTKVEKRRLFKKIKN